MERRKRGVQTEAEEPRQGYAGRRRCSGQEISWPRRVPVTSKPKVVGIISRPDVLRCILEQSGEKVET
ncbi:MAG: hypothetical protein ACYTEQ_10165 [Planctomycetota bacterium]|jgi:hypothetical protein